MISAEHRPLRAVAPHTSSPFQSAAVVEHVLTELTAAHADFTLDDLMQGRIQVYSTVDARVQRIVSDALEHGLERYERRHPSGRGVVQGSIVVLMNRDGSILAETGGRQVYHGRATAHSDFNRVRQSLRQPGSAMKPFVYLAAFRHGDFTLETLVPDEPISVPSGSEMPKWIANYDGRFKGMIPIREALAESRNAVAIWITEQIGIDAVLKASRSLGVRTPLQRYATTALGASEVSLLELATAYRTIASGVIAEPFVVRHIVRDSSEIRTGGRTSGRVKVNRRHGARDDSGRAAGCRASADRDSACPRLARLSDSGDGKDGHDQRLQRRALRWVDLRRRWDHDRGTDRVRRQSVASARRKPAGEWRCRCSRK